MLLILIKLNVIRVFYHYFQHYKQFSKLNIHLTNRNCKKEMNYCDIDKFKNVKLSKIVSN